MSESDLKRELVAVQEKGFDDSFPEFCARTFESFKYPPERLAAARCHALWLRTFLEDYLSEMALSPDEEPSGDIYEMAIEIGRQVIDWSLKRDMTTGDEFCREFVRRWCERCAKG